MFASFLAIAAATVSLHGTFALERGIAKTQGHLIARQIGTSPLHQRLDLWLTDERSQPIRRYDVDMTKLLHLIAIGDDFNSFQHLHPALEADGHFTIDATFPKAETYHIYADSEPDRFGQQVFRYDLRVGAADSPERDIAATGGSVSADAYAVTLGTTRLRANAETEIAVRVAKDGKPASDLRPYLGALAHAVFIDADDLTYAHVHPTAAGGAHDDSMAGMDMSATPIPDSVATSPDMVLHVRIAKPGTYKLWLQFRSATGLHVAPFVLRAT